MKSSSYSMSFKKYILIEILAFAISAVSLSSLVPLMTFYRYKSEAEATILNGKQLKFVGKIKDIYLIYIAWILITAIVIFLYQAFFTKIIDALYEPLPSPLYYLLSTTIITFISSIFIKSAFRRWKYRSTVIDNNYSFYKGNMIKVVLVSLLRKILNVVSGGLFYPFIKEISYKYELSGVTLSGYKIECEGIARRMYKTWFKNLFFSVFTFGLYLIYCLYNYQKLNISNIELIEEKLSK